MQVVIFGALAEDQAFLVVEVFRMLADTTRIQLLQTFRDTELSVNELAERVGNAAPLVSRHLTKLRRARPVPVRLCGGLKEAAYHRDN